MNYETLTVATKNDVATVTINRPTKLNALNRQVLEDLQGAVQQLSSSIRVAILTGAGDRAFVAGADIAEMSGLSVAEATAFSEAGHRVCHLIEQSPAPFIAAVNGFALGGGCELALACDFIYASEKAKFGQPEVNLGIIPGFGGTQRLARRVGLGRARELIYTGDAVSAQRALEIGLVNRVLSAEDLVPTVESVAEKIASKGPLAIAASKQCLLAGADAALTTGCTLEIRAFAGLFGSEDMREGTRAFVEKRPAKFTGR